MTRHAYGVAISESDFLTRYGWTAISTQLRAEMEYGSEEEVAVPRSLHHFYDPQASLPLTEPVLLGGVLVCTNWGKTAPAWGLDYERTFLYPFTGYNKFSLRDANGYLWHALTEREPVQRLKATRALFRTLGHLVHLLQDMAQPDHTRNDQHLSLGFVQAKPWRDAGAALYETWTEKWLLNSATLPGGTPVAQLFEQPVPTSGFDAVTTHGYRYLYDTLARYSSHGFVTQDTNYGDTPLCVPNPDPQEAYAVPRLQTTSQQVWDNVNGGFRTVIIDEIVYTGRLWGTADEDSYHAFKSLIDHEASRPEIGGRNVYSLSDQSWESRAKLLIPRAVGDSAELIKYFFHHRAGASFVPVDDDKLLLYAGVNGAVPANAQIVVLRMNDDQELERIYPLPTLAAAPIQVGVSEVSIPFRIGGEPFYRKQLRVAIRGDVSKSPERDERDKVMVAILPARNELRAVVRYDAAYAYGYNTVDLHLWRLGTSEIGVTSAHTDNFGNHQNASFTRLSRAPFAGTIDANIGLTDGESAEIALQVLPQVPWPHPPGFVSPGNAIVDLYRNGALVESVAIAPDPSFRVQMRFRITGAGQLTALPW